jgi:hypothetical protein
MTQLTENNSSRTSLIANRLQFFNRVFSANAGQKSIQNSSNVSPNVARVFRVVRVPALRREDPRLLTFSRNIPIPESARHPHLHARHTLQIPPKAKKLICQYQHHR